MQNRGFMRIIHFSKVSTASKLFDHFTNEFSNLSTIFLCQCDKYSSLPFQSKLMVCYSLQKLYCFLKIPLFQPSPEKMYFCEQQFYTKV